jgi:hypothetical protein
MGSVYPPFTSVRRFWCIPRFWRFMESTTYTPSSPRLGSNPTLSAKLLVFSGLPSQLNLLEQRLLQNPF